MHVGVEKAIAHGVAQERLDHDAAKLRQVVALLGQRGAVGRRRALDPFECARVLGGVTGSSTAGARKSVSSLVFSAISDSAAASSRKSISTLTERASVSTTSAAALGE